MKRNVPKLRFKEFDDEWKNKKVGDLYNDLKAGSTPSKLNSNYFKGDIPWITSGELKSKYIYSTLEYITEEAKNSANLKLYDEGTLFIAITGLEAPGTRGSCAINKIKATTNQSCLAFQKSHLVNNEFIYYWYNLYGEYIGITFTQGTKQQSLNNKLVSNLKISIPSLQEQEKIANFLTKVDSLIEEQDGKVKDLELYKKGMMQKIFSQEIRFKDDNGCEYPEWEEKKLTKIIYNKSKGNIPNYCDYKANILLSNEYLENKTKEKVYVTNENNVSKNDILILWDGSQSGKVYTGVEGVLGSTFVAIKLNKPNNNYFVYQYLNYKKPVIQDVWREGSGVPHVAKDFIDNFKINIPCLEEQTKIANFLSNIDSIIEEENNKLEDLRQWKKGLLQWMFV